MKKVLFLFVLVLGISPVFGADNDVCNFEEPSGNDYYASVIEKGLKNVVDNKLENLYRQVEKKKANRSKQVFIYKNIIAKISKLEKRSSLKSNEKILNLLGYLKERLDYKVKKVELSVACSEKTLLESLLVGTEESNNCFYNNKSFGNRQVFDQELIITIPNGIQKYIESRICEKGVMNYRGKTYKSTHCNTGYSNYSKQCKKEEVVNYHGWLNLSVSNDDVINKDHNPETEDSDINIYEAENQGKNVALVDIVGTYEDIQIKKIKVTFNKVVTDFNKKFPPYIDFYKPGTKIPQNYLASSGTSAFNGKDVVYTYNNLVLKKGLNYKMYVVAHFGGVDIAGLKLTGMEILEAKGMTSGSDIKVDGNDVGLNDRLRYFNFIAEEVSKPKDCSFYDEEDGTKMLKHGTSDWMKKSMSINHGTKYIKQLLSCDNGIISTDDVKDRYIVCDNGYNLEGSECILKKTDKIVLMKGGYFDLSGQKWTSDYVRVAEINLTASDTTQAEIKDFGIKFSLTNAHGNNIKSVRFVDASGFWTSHFEKVSDTVYKHSGMNFGEAAFKAPFYIEVKVDEPSSLGMGITTNIYKVTSGEGYNFVFDSAAIGGVNISEKYTEYKTYWDIDGDGELNEEIDGKIILRYLFGFNGDSLIQDISFSSSASRTSSKEIEIYINSLDFDIDGNGSTKALTDGILLNRFMAGFSGHDLIKDAVAPDASRQSEEKIIEYIKSREN